MKISDFIMSSLVFWMAWIIIPFVVEIIPSILNFFILISVSLKRKNKKEINFFPDITLIIPVYNSEKSLYRCIKSVYDSDYDNDKIFVLLVNNETNDNSFAVFHECQKDFPKLSMNWLDSKQGKSKALNLALFNSYGKYIINIDSDGVLHPFALKNMVTKFEQNDNIHCMTGTIMTNPRMIEDTKKKPLKLLRDMEFYEYCQAFLAGRNFQSETNSIYTLSGAFSAFRKSTILKTQLYNTETVCEDTHITFQIRDALNTKILSCNDAFFFIDPIESINQLYTQRQRWQIGEIEVAHMFLNKKKTTIRHFFSNIVIKLLVFDHTFAFPRMIWYFALIVLGFMNYPFKLITQSIGIIYFLYVFSDFLFFLNINFFLKKYKGLKKYYNSKWLNIFTLPIFNFIVFWFRFAGIINSIKSKQTWRSKNLTEEWQSFKKIILKDFYLLNRLINKIKRKVNYKDV